MRLFIASAVHLSHYEEIRETFSPLVEGRWVAEQNLHLTWIFLGERDDAEEIRQQLRQVRPLSRQIVLRGLGSFGRPLKIFYAAVRDRSLWKKASQLHAAGFANERFRPHVTLCRVKKVLDAKRFREAVATYRNRKIGYIEKSIHLCESRLLPEGAAYRIVG